MAGAHTADHDRARRGVDGESYEAHRERVVAALLRIASRRPGGHVLAVTHGGSLRRCRSSSWAKRSRSSTTVTLDRHSSGRRHNGVRLKPRWTTTRASTRASRWKSHCLEATTRRESLPPTARSTTSGHVELNGHILIPLQNVASLHCSSRCDAPQPDWPPRGLAEDENRRRALAVKGSALAQARQNLLKAWLLLAGLCAVARPSLATASGGSTTRPIFAFFGTPDRSQLLLVRRSHRDRHGGALESCPTG